MQRTLGSALDDKLVDGQARVRNSRNLHGAADPENADNEAVHAKTELTMQLSRDSGQSARTDIGEPFKPASSMASQAL
ncbi:MAG: hypothetical protein R3D67_08020 [Hyphomicrobiaceae bacterium]